MVAFAENEDGKENEVFGVEEIREQKRIQELDPKEERFPANTSKVRLPLFTLRGKCT